MTALVLHLKKSMKVLMDDCSRAAPLKYVSMLILKCLIVKNNVWCERYLYLFVAPIVICKQISMTTLFTINIGRIRPCAYVYILRLAGSK